MKIEFERVERVDEKSRILERNQIQLRLFRDKKGLKVGGKTILIFSCNAQSIREKVEELKRAVIRARSGWDFHPFLVFHQININNPTNHSTKPLSFFKEETK